MCGVQVRVADTGVFDTHQRLEWSWRRSWNLLDDEWFVE
jgi:hypothetical protein